MNGDGIPDRVRAFIAEHVRSVADLEALLLLRSDPRREWRAPELAHELRVEPKWMEPTLVDLNRRGMIAAIHSAGPTLYRYAPASAEIDAAIRDLAEAYAGRRVTVIHLIFAPRSASPLSTTLQSFADAFRLRKE